MNDVVIIGDICPFCEMFVGEKHPEIDADRLEENEALIRTIMFRVQNMHLQEHVDEMVTPAEEDDDGSG